MNWNELDKNWKKFAKKQNVELVYIEQNFFNAIRCEYIINMATYSYKTKIIGTLWKSQDGHNRNDTRIYTKYNNRDSTQTLDIDNSIIKSWFAKKIKKDVIKKFKNTETIFLLSNVYNKSEYQEILKASWNVTPYKIVDFENFEIENYVGDKYSIAQLSGFKRIKQMQHGGTSTSLFTYIDIKIYDSEKIFKKLNKLSPKRRAKKKNDIINDNSSNIARFYIFSKDDFIHTSLSEDMNTIVNSLYNDDVFFNYKLGFLKNYF